MEEIELINLWKDYDRKIEESRILNLQSWVVNLKTFEYLQAHKAKTRLHSLQVKLSELQASTIRIIRLLWLQMPFYTTWFWNEEWMSQHTTNFLLTGVPGTILFTLLALWLYRNISYKNVHKKWFGLLLGKDWTSVKKAVDYLEEIEEFKRGT